MLIGFLLFSVIYSENANNDFSKLVEKPDMVFAMLIPFLPAVILTLMANRMQDKLSTYKSNKAHTKTRV